MLLLFVSIFMPRLLAVRCKRIVRHRLIYYCRIWFRNMSNFPTLRTMPHAEPVYFTRYTLEPFPISHDNWHIRCFYFNVSHWLQCANFARSFLCNSAERANSGASKGRGLLSYGKRHPIFTRAPCEVACNLIVSRSQSLTSYIQTQGLKILALYS